MLLSPNDVQQIGLEIMNVRLGKKSEKRLLLEFHKHYGSSPLDLACQWNDLCFLDPNVLTSKEKTKKGFKRFLAAHYFLWARPKNIHLFASRFGVGVDYVQGHRLWSWLERIANLTKYKIVWDETFDDEEFEIFLITGDGCDFKIWETKHLTIQLIRRPCLIRCGTVQQNISFACLSSVLNACSLKVLSVAANPI